MLVANVSADIVPLIEARSGRKRVCECCQAPPFALCDWKTGRLGERCDSLLCENCAYQPWEGKHLCPTHWQMLLERVERASSAPQRIRARATG